MMDDMDAKKAALQQIIDYISGLMGDRIKSKAMPPELSKPGMDPEDLADGGADDAEEGDDPKAMLIKKMMAAKGR